MNLVEKSFVGLRVKTYSYLTDAGSEDKKAKGTKKCAIKRKFKFENYKNYLEATQFENKRNHLKKNQNDVNSLKKHYKEFVKNNKLILKTPKRLKGKRHNVFTEQIIKIALSSNDDKRIQSIDSIETYAYGMNEDLASKKEEIKRKNIRKQYKNY